MRALWLLLHDLLSRFVFAGLYVLTRGGAVAVGVGIAAGAVGTGRARTRRGRIAGMQWLRLFLAVVFGGMTLLSGRPTFAMLKPAQICGMVAFVLLLPGWVKPLCADDGAWRGLAWLQPGVWYGSAALFGFIATAGLAVALLATTATLAFLVPMPPDTAECILVGCSIERHAGWCDGGMIG